MLHRGLRAGGRTHLAKRFLRPESVRPGRRVPCGKAVAARRGHGQRPTRAVRGRGGARRRGAKRFHRMNRRAACRRVLRGVPGNAKDRGKGRTTGAPGSGPGRTGARAARSERSRTRGGGPRPLGGRLRLGTREAAGRHLPGGSRGPPGRAPAAGPDRRPGPGRGGHRRPERVRSKTPPRFASQSASPRPEWVPGNAKDRGKGRTTGAPGSRPGRPGARAARSERSRTRGGGPRPLGGRPRRGVRETAGRHLPGGSRGPPGRAPVAGPDRRPGPGRGGHRRPERVRSKTPPRIASKSASPRPEWVPGEPWTSGSRRAGSGSTDG